VNNPDPIARAWRLERRRKQLGSSKPRCFYCPESELPCLELDHPVTKELDPEFTRIECRNHHRKLEFMRDLKKLTNNGRRDVKESEGAQLRRYLLLLAEDQDSIADAVLSRAASSDLVAAALRSTTTSLRRKAEELTR
jgi:hypothetical protein